MARINFTAARISSFAAVANRPAFEQVFLWDAKVLGLGARLTRNGACSYVFQSRLAGKGLRITIGDVSIWSVGGAQVEARRLQGLIDQGRDPRAEKATNVAREQADRAARLQERQRREITGLEAWAAYCADRKPAWGDRSYLDHISFAKEGGAYRTRWAGKLTMPGPLRALLARSLASIDSDAVYDWAVREVRHRPTSAQHGFRMLRAFFNWCIEDKHYKRMVDVNPCNHKRTREKLGSPRVKKDALQREQLAAWFVAVRRIPNPVMSAFVQALLLTGARVNEVLAMRWEDVDFNWKSIKIGDKVDGERVIPLTPYMARLLLSLPRRNQYVFASSSKVGAAIQAPRDLHAVAVRSAELPPLSFHGLRRSFGTLAEWLDMPIGIAAQIQGHKPTALAEKHYRVRPIDLLRLWHERIETFILENAGIMVGDRPLEPRLSLVAA